MARKKKDKLRIAVIDCETDPFKFGRKPMPFVWGFYDGETYLHFWGDNCTEQLLAYLESRKDPLTIYAHNGGKFDFFFLLEYGVIENPALIIHGRIVKARCLSIHEIRDSFAILPVPLKKLGNQKGGEKKEIDYALMEREVREKNKNEILEYLKPDCTVLYWAVFEFLERFGNKLTIGATAISELQKLHPLIRLGKSHDEKFRPFYFGGRVQCFESGHVKPRFKDRIKIFDVNSMYPAVMKNFVHPLGGNYVSLKTSAIEKFDIRTGNLRGFGGMYFAHFRGTSKGALPVRNEKTGGLDFPIGEAEFYACSHEIRTACELGLLKILEIYDVYVPCSFQSYDAFVDKFIGEKIEGKRVGDFAKELFSKLIANSAYGKYASNPALFKEWWIYDEWADDDEKIAFEEWRDANPKIIDEETGKVISLGAELVQDLGRFEIWQAPSPNDDGYFDVAIAASITSAARSVLLRAIHGALRPIYCDTDSLICEDLRNVIINDFDLGAWKFEGATKEIFVAGKKLYSCKLDEIGKDGKPKFKQASKGAKLTHDDMIKLCAGEIVHWQNDAPNFKWSGDVKFVARNIRKNA